jgi:hypothetical protein
MVPGSGELGETLSDYGVLCVCMVTSQLPVACNTDRHSRVLLAGIQVFSNIWSPRQRHAGVTGCVAFIQRACGNDDLSQNPWFLRSYAGWSRWEIPRVFGPARWWRRFCLGQRGATLELDEQGRRSLPSALLSGITCRQVMCSGYRRTNTRLFSTVSPPEVRTLIRLMALSARRPFALSMVNVHNPSSLAIAVPICGAPRFGELKIRMREPGAGLRKYRRLSRPRAAVPLPAAPPRDLLIPVPPEKPIHHAGGSGRRVRRVFLRRNPPTSWVETDQAGSGSCRPGFGRVLDCATRGTSRGCAPSC